MHKMQRESEVNRNLNRIAVADCCLSLKAKGQGPLRPSEALMLDAKRLRASSSDLPNLNLFLVLGLLLRFPKF